MKVFQNLWGRRKVFFNFLKVFCRHRKMSQKGFFDGFSRNPGVPESGGHGLRKIMRSGLVWSNLVGYIWLGIASQLYPVQV